MTWKSATHEEQVIFQQIMLWIRTAREAGKKYHHPHYAEDWLPSDADFAKSALMERIRNGLQPMAEPPPVGYSCPWYAVVEDAGPHYIFDVTTEAAFLAADEVHVAQNRFKIYERLGDREYIVGDCRGTSYRFRLWYDPEWTPRSVAQNPRKGGWFIQNVAFQPGGTTP